MVIASAEEAFAVVSREAFAVTVSSEAFVVTVSKAFVATATALEAFVVQVPSVASSAGSFHSVASTTFAVIVSQEALVLEAFGWTVSEAVEGSERAAFALVMVATDPNLV